MSWTLRRLAAALALSLVVTGCDGGEPEIAAVSFDEVRKAAGEGDAAFEAYFDKVKGKTVKWSGRVVEALKEVEDDYMATGRLLVDMDGAGAAPATADVEFKIKPSQLASFSPGQAVDFTGVLREFETRKGLLLKLEVKDVKPR